MRQAFRWLGVASASLMAMHASAFAQETSIRTSAWSDNRTGGLNDDATFTAELWGRGRWEAGAGLTVQAEGWLATDPTGSGRSDVDIREAYLGWSGDGVRLNVGRQVFAWGRADRLNPTDIFSARDYRRLVIEDDDARLGIAAVSAQFDVADGELSVIWAPEFRRTTLPQLVAPYGVPRYEQDPDTPEGQFALRYEQFGQALDWSITYAEAFDRVPWAARPDDPEGKLAVALLYPRQKMLGADLATTIADYGVRAEAAFYDYDRPSLVGVAARVPRFALALGADRDLPGQFNVNVQALMRSNEALQSPAPRLAPFARGNGSIHYTWRDTVVGGLARVRHTFDSDQGSVEASIGGFSGGGSFAQVKLVYAMADGIRLIGMVERYAGSPGTQLGRLKDNSLFTVGIRYGY